MKVLQKILLLMLALTLAFSLFACGGGDVCTKHVDEDEDGICDVCESEIKGPQSKESLTLVDNGEGKFAIVLGSDIPVSVRLAADMLRRDLAKLDITVEVLDDEPTDETFDVEVLVGTVESRGEDYKFNKYSLGYEGYMIKIVGSKILISGGSDSMLEDAFDEFVEDILLFDDLEDADGELTVTMTAKQNVEEIFDDYAITSIKIGGKEITDFVIATDFGDADYYTMASELQSQIYKKAGYYLPFKPINEVSGNAIVLRRAEKDDTGADSYRVYEQNGSLYIECEYHNRFISCTSTFIAKNLTSKSGDLSFAGDVYKEDISFVTYEMFGADGKDTENDFKAIYDTHEFANISGQLVKAKDGATYYITDTRIEGSVRTAIIKTNVDWGTAKFEIIDTNLSAWDGTQMYASNIFKVASEKSSYELSAEQIAKINEEKVGRNSTRLNVTLPAGAMLNVFNDDTRVYIRYGKNGNNATTGSAQHEIVLVDKDGNIDPSTPFLLDYEKVTRVEVYSITDAPLSIRGGIFYTRASQQDTSHDDGTVYTQYFKRGINVQRSNVTISDSQHYVTGQFTRAQTDNQGLRNPSYSAFYNYNSCYNVKLYNCIVTAKMGNGTYDIGANTVCNMTFEKCEQSNFFLEDGITPSTTGQQYWGVAGTNYCKNMSYIDSKLTRYDAHAGVYNGKIINCDIALIYLIGGGTMEVINSRIHNNYLFSCRIDYGATWNGVVKFKDCTMITTKSELGICSAVWTNHDYGYTCYYPNIEVDNLVLQNATTNEIALDITGNQGEPHVGKPRHTSMYYEGNLHGEYLSTGEENVNRYVPPSSLLIKHNNAGLVYTIPNRLIVDGNFLSETDIEGFIFE